MAIDGLGAVSNPSAALANAGISQDQFLRILITQLRFQNPLKPVENEQFLAQLAQFSALQINREQSDKIDLLVSMEATGQAMSLIGRSVQLSGNYANEIGQVDAISFSSGEPLLAIKTRTTTLTNVRLSDVMMIVDLEQTTPTTPTIPTPTIPIPGR